MHTAQRLIAAIGALNDEKVEKTGRMLGYAEGGSRGRRVGASVRRGLVLAAAAALLLALGITAYALGLGSIRELWPKTNAEHTAFPETAAEWIQPRGEAIQAGDWIGRILETYCDDTRIIVTASVTCGDRFLPVPTDADESFPAAAYGFEGEGTLGEYAAERGKTLLFMNLGVNVEQVGEISASLHFENVSDSELLIMHDGSRNGSFDTLDTSCAIVAQRADTGELERAEVPLTLMAGTSKTLGVYVPGDPNAVPGVRNAGEATLTETPFGLTLQYPAEREESDAGRSIMYVACEEINFRGQSALGFTAGDGTAYTRLTMGEGEAPDTLTIHYYDWDKRLVGDLVFVRAGG